MAGDPGLVHGSLTLHTDTAVISVYPYNKGGVTENISTLRQKKEEIDYYALWLIAVAYISYFKENQL